MQRPGPEPPSVCPAGAEPSPALLVPSAKRRSRKTSKDTGDSKDGSALGTEEPGAKARGRGRKPSTKAKSGMSAPAWPWPRPRGRCGNGWAWATRTPLWGLGLGYLDCVTDWETEARGGTWSVGTKRRFSQVVRSSIRGQVLGAKTAGDHTGVTTDRMTVTGGPRVGAAQGRRAGLETGLSG